MKKERKKEINLSDNYTYKSMAVYFKLGIKWFSRK